jgi:hypothetical protein
MPKRAAKSSPATEVDLRVQLAERRAERDQKVARSLCAVSSELCRAGAEWEWFDLTDTRGHQTFCFCPGHALAAELCCAGDEDIYPSMSPAQFLSAVARAEARAHNERRHQEVDGV